MTLASPPPRQHPDAVVGGLAGEGARSSAERGDAATRAAHGAPATAPLPILLYHSVCPDPPADLLRWSVTPETFEAHLDAFGELGLVPWSVSRLVAALRAGAEVPRPVVVVTFDDGYADFAEHALPALERHRVPATIYLTTGALAGVVDPVVPRMPIAPMLALGDLAELERRGVEIGAHGHGHWQLDAVPERFAALEITRSKEVLEEALGHRVESFAYPHGYSSPKVRRLVARAGFSSACAVRNAFSSRQDDHYALARLTVEHDTPPETLRSWLAGRGAAVATPHEQLKTQVWRWYRRATTLPIRPGRSDRPAAACAARG
jgi:peptidoglycan/xylan/chitin deacetylase (PgdA/CDA1 family)